MEPEGVAQLFVGSACFGTRGRALHGADEDVLRAVLERDELDQLRPVSAELEQLGAERVRDERRKTLLREPVPEDWPEQRALDLPVGLLLAAGNGQDHVRLPANRLRQRLVGGGVARVRG